jgi:putative membrane-bound dehydrogenase-like protein
MRSPRLISCLASFALLAAASANAAEPRLLVEQPGFGLELVAREPDIVTPIALAFDKQGRLLVIESHTHQRPADYDGPPGDRIRALEDSNGDDRLDRWSTFAEGFQQAMGLCVRPDGGVYLVTRRDVRLLEDTDGDGVSDKDTPILRLETDQNYPHNGMGGITFIPGDERRGLKGAIVLGIGENFGSPYTLVGTDGVEFTMNDGAGNVFLCQPDGSGLRRVATGFWNPFALCHAGNSIYCVDNDPDASPPCRLIDVWSAGDYGFRFQYGRAGTHPLLAWHGELPGTLGPICGTGEAPTAIVFHHGFLWVTSWGDHRVERYSPLHAGEPTRPERKARMQVVVQGDEDFRPTGCAVAPDGSLYFADWVSRSYPVHGQGRIWRLSLPPADVDRLPLETTQVANSFQKAWDSRDSPYGERGRTHIATGDAAPQSLATWREASLDVRLRGLEALRWKGTIDGASYLRSALADADANVRLFAVRWIADERLDGYRDDIANLLDGDIPNERYFLAVLAAIEWLDGDASPRASGISDGLLRRELANARRSPQIKALALRLISPDHEWLTIDRLREYLASDSPELRLEAVRTLAMQTRADRLALLAEIAADDARDDSERAEAIVGLASAAGEHGELLEKLAAGDDIVAKEAARVLRLSRKRQSDPVAGSPQRPAPTDLQAWNTLLNDGGDADSGRRLFFTNQTLCATCHQHSGRGGRIGPDLTRLGEQQSRERIIASLLQPSQEIAPHYQAWTLVTTDGLTREGLRLPEGGDDGTEPYADVQGRRFELRSEDIELRSPSQASIMPEGLTETLSIDDLRDLVAFLATKPGTDKSTPSAQ